VLIQKQPRRWHTKKDLRSQDGLARTASQDGGNIRMPARMAGISFLRQDSQTKEAVCVPMCLHIQDSN
jgi:hypothetical protein